MIHSRYYCKPRNYFARFKKAKFARQYANLSSRKIAMKSRASSFTLPQLVNHLTCLHFEKLFFLVVYKNRYRTESWITDIRSSDRRPYL